VNSWDQYGWTPLHGASQFGRLEVLRLLLALDSDVNAREQTHWSSLHLASVNGHIGVVQLLLERGKNVEAKNEERRTSFDEALRSGETEIASLLSQHASGSRGEYERVLFEGPAYGSRGFGLRQGVEGGERAEKMWGEGPLPTTLACLSTTYNLYYLVLG